MTGGVNPFLRNEQPWSNAYPNTNIRYLKDYIKFRSFDVRPRAEVFSPKCEEEGERLIYLR